MPRHTCCRASSPRCRGVIGRRWGCLGLEAIPQLSPNRPRPRTTGPITTGSKPGPGLTGWGSGEGFPAGHNVNRVCVGLVPDFAATSWRAWLRSATPWGALRAKLARIAEHHRQAVRLLGGFIRLASSARNWRSRAVRALALGLVYRRLMGSDRSRSHKLIHHVGICSIHVRQTFRGDTRR